MIHIVIEGDIADFAAHQFFVRISRDLRHFRIHTNPSAGKCRMRHADRRSLACMQIGSNESLEPNDSVKRSGASDQKQNQQDQRDQTGRAEFIHGTKKVERHLRSPKERQTEASTPSTPGINATIMCN
jgi:hypothetical protein